MLLGEARPACPTFPGPPHSQSGLRPQDTAFRRAVRSTRRSSRIIPLVDLAEEDVLLARATLARDAAGAAVDRYADGIGRDRPLVGRLEERRSEERAMVASVRQEMANYAVALRALGTPPQEALVLLKHLAESAPFQRLPSRSPVMIEVRAAVVDWFVEAYYSGVSPAAPPARRVTGRESSAG